MQRKGMFSMDECLSVSQMADMHGITRLNFSMPHNPPSNPADRMAELYAEAFSEILISGWSFAL